MKYGVHKEGLHMTMATIITQCLMSIKNLAMVDYFFELQLMGLDLRKATKEVDIECHASTLPV